MELEMWNFISIEIRPWPVPRIRKQCNFTKSAPLCNATLKHRKVLPRVYKTKEMQNLNLFERRNITRRALFPLITTIFCFENSTPLPPFKMVIFGIFGLIVFLKHFWATILDLMTFKPREFVSSHHVLQIKSKQKSI